MIDLVTDAIACYRITRLINEDVILDRPRDAIIDWATKGDCTAELRGQNETDVLRCERPGGHSGQHLRTVPSQGGPPSRVNWDDDTDGAQPPDPALRLHPKVAEFIGCAWCISFYCAIGVVIARRHAPRQWTPIAQVLAFSGVTGFLSSR